MSGAGLVSRVLNRVRELVASATHLGKAPDESDLERLRTQLQECAEGRGGEVSTRQRAARLAETYLRLDDAGRHAFLRLIAHGYSMAEVAERLSLSIKTVDTYKTRLMEKLGTTKKSELVSYALKYGLLSNE